MQEYIKEDYVDKIFGGNNFVNYWLEESYLMFGEGRSNWLLATPMHHHHHHHPPPPKKKEKSAKHMMI